jgi:glycosyltransferase involved in cell wall biosynthesis
LLAVIGFVADSKGVHHAIDALSFLPGNFKLVVIGGLHPNQGYSSDYLQQLLDRIVERGLQSRFCFTGYIEDEAELISAVSECDICLFPYDFCFYRAVTSGSIGLATAAHKPAIVFPTPAFEELSLYNKSVQVCKLANGYELAREVMKLNIEDKSNEASKYSAENSYDAIALRLAQLYGDLVF